MQLSFFAITGMLGELIPRIPGTNNNCQINSAGAGPVGPKVPTLLASRPGGGAGLTVMQRGTFVLLPDRA
jgi:hypothetical protein